MNHLRNLRPDEIATLRSQACRADDWNQVWVPEVFDIEYVNHVRFSGVVKLGAFRKVFTLPGGLVKHSGLRHVTLHNCTLGDNVLIENVQNYIANYRIGDDCFIQNINVMLVEGKATFGNNVEVSVLNETGGREVPIYDGLSASLAYIIALYRHRPALIERLRDMITAYTEGIASTEGTVGDKVKIVNTGTIRNVKIGDYATIENSARLENGSVNSKREAPVFIGDSVIAQDFIVSSGAKIADAAKIIRCFIGQACQVTHNFSAHDSLLFSNCAFENGEACAIFAGPFTVSMHKSSLLIAGMYSFLNAGSGIIDVIKGHRDNPTGNANATPTGYYVRKYMPENILTNNHAGVEYRNWIIFRYAEILLNYAEALCESGKVPEALQAIQPLRDRVGLSLKLTERADLKEQEAALHFIRKERTVELAFEDHRAWDLRRWNVAEKALARDIYGVEVTQERGQLKYTRKVVGNRVFEEKMYLYPIPEAEVWKTGIENNPGW